MKNYLVILFFGLAFAVCAFFADQLAAQQKDKEKSIAIQRGTVATRQAKELPRFKEPIRTALGSAPALPRDRPNSTWRWHPSHGWVLLDRAVAPVGSVLPLDYALPPQVVVYEDPLVSPGVRWTATCPHCGQVFVIEVK